MFSMLVCLTLDQVDLGFVYTDAVSNRNGFLTWRPH